MANSILAPTHRYAAGGLLALALYQAQIHQTRPLGSPTEDDEDGNGERMSSGSSSDSVSEDPQLWIHEKSGLLRPVFRILEIDTSAWQGLEETGGSSTAKHHIGAFLRLLAEDDGEPSSERLEQELVLTKGVDAMAMSMEIDSASIEAYEENTRKYEQECEAKLSKPQKQSPSKEAAAPSETFQELSSETSTKEEEELPNALDRKFSEEPVEEIALLSYQRKVVVLYGLLSACLANKTEKESKDQKSRLRKGYDARYRVALRLLATWLDLKWAKMEAMEVMVACSAMALMKEEEANEKETKPEEGKWAKWKRGGIIGAAAVTGGTLLAITGGLAAPAIAAGFGALAPTLGTIIPVIGASGFAAAASAAGSVAGSVAVAASFGAAGAGLSGTKMARRIGSIDEFEFKAVGDNHNQGRLSVGILISGLVFEEEDFVRPWEGQDNLERYALQWESKIVMAVSSAIQDWLTSRITRELMTQGAMMTVLHTLVAAFAWPATLLSATDFIDSKWTIAVDSLNAISDQYDQGLSLNYQREPPDGGFNFGELPGQFRSDKAGKLLAEVLLKGLQGNRPVTLIGFSLGARVIFKCLECLAETEDNAAAGLVERVVLLGAPIPIKDENWKKARTMVAGRFVNAYSTTDWTLGVTFRANLFTRGLAGIQPIDDVPGIENVDVTELIEGHSSYLWKTRQVIDQLELETYYPIFNSSPVKLQEEKAPET